MSKRSADFAPLYRAALEEHLGATAEEALHRAYEIGRAALSTGELGVVDLVLLHHEALSSLMRSRSGRNDKRLAAAADFLAEALSPFEMMLRGYREANERLSTANSELARANVAVAAAHEALKLEVLERQRAEEALVHAQKLQAVGLLAGGVAHHFNNLLTIVLGNIHMARTRGREGEDIERFLADAKIGAERGAEVVKQLLMFSRQQALETRVLDVDQWLSGLSPLLGGALRGDITVSVEVDRPVWPVRVDATQLELALLNLAVNARDAMPKGGSLLISVANRTVDDKRLGLGGDYVAIEVADTGEGVDPKIISRVFEPFFTTKEVGRGAGLGLSQVHGFMHQSGGAVDLTSVPGQGTTVHLYLPAAVGAMPEARDLHIIPRALNAHGRVLVVDDDVDVADLTGRLLEGRGYTVKLAHCAKAALELLDAGEPIDLLLSDIIMPGGMNGVELAIAARHRFPKLPILLATGYSEAGPLAAAKGLSIITKPYDVDVLCAQVGELMEDAVR